MSALTNREIKFTVKMRNDARQAMQAVGSDLRRMASDARTASAQARQGIDSVGDAADRTKGRVGGLSAVLRGIGWAALAAAAVAAGRAIIGAGDNYTEMSNRLISIGIAAEDAGGMLRELNAIARSSGSDLESTVTLYSRASVALGEMGAGADETARFVTTWQRAMSVGGASAQEAASATLQFSQALGSGVLRGEEFNAVNEASPYLMRRLAEAMGVPVGALRGMAMQGRITSDVLRQAMADMAEGVDADFARTRRTAAQAWTGFVDQVKLSIGAAMSAIGGSEGLASLIDGATAAVRAFSDHVSVVGPAVGEVFREIGLALQPVIEAIGNWITGTREAGEESIGFGTRVTTTFVWVARNIAAAIRWMRENWSALGDWLGRLWQNIGNAIMRPVVEAFRRVEALSGAMAATLRGDFDEAGRLSARAFGNAITEEVRRLYPEIQTAFRQASQFQGVSWSEARRIVEAGAATGASPTTTMSDVQPVAPISPAARDDAEATADATGEIRDNVEDVTDAVVENRSAWGVMRDAARNAIDQMGQAFENFITTGKLNFKQLVASILADLARMMASQAWQQIIGMVRGPGGSTPPYVPGNSGGGGGNWLSSAFNFIAGLFHDGGMVGAMRSARAVSPGVFANARRYHSGGLVGLSHGEVPIIAKRHEAVMPTVRLPDGNFGVRAEMVGGGRAVINNTVNVHVEGGGKDAEQIGAEVAQQTMAQLERMSRAAARDEIRAAQEYGGMNNWRP